MKKTALVLALMVAAAAAGPTRPLPAQTPTPALTGRLSLSGAWAIYPMAVKWAEEFQKLHPGVRIDVQAGGAGKGIADVLAGAVDIGMVSREVNAAETAKGAVAVPVAKDAVVPTVSRRNPFLPDILRRGLRKQDFAAIWISGSAPSWERLLGRAGGTAVRVYTRSDACGAAETWAAFLGKRGKFEVVRFNMEVRFDVFADFC